MINIEKTFLNSIENSKRIKIIWNSTALSKQGGIADHPDLSV